MGAWIKVRDSFSAGKGRIQTSTHSNPLTPLHECQDLSLAVAASWGSQNENTQKNCLLNTKYSQEEGGVNYDFK